MLVIYDRRKKHKALRSGPSITSKKWAVTIYQFIVLRRFSSSFSVYSAVFTFLEAGSAELESVKLDFMVFTYKTRLFLKLVEI